MNITKNVVAVKGNVKKVIEKKGKQKSENDLSTNECKKMFSYSQFDCEYDKKKNIITLSVIRTPKGKTDGRKATTTIKINSLLPIFEKLKKIKDGKERRKQTVKAIEVYRKELVTFAPRGHVLRPLFRVILENFKKDYNCLIQKSFQI